MTQVGECSHIGWWVEIMALGSNISPISYPALFTKDSWKVLFIQGLKFFYLDKNPNN